MNTAKLAEEYAQQTFDKNDPRYPQLVQDFKDVIKKATEEITKQRDDEMEANRRYRAHITTLNNRLASRAAHASDMTQDEYNQLARNTARESKSPTSAAHASGPHRSDGHRILAEAVAQSQRKPDSDSGGGCTITEAHEKIQSGLAAARLAPEYEQEGRELASGGGEEWTKETVSQLLADAFSSGDEHGRGLQAIADAHNQSLQPRDCGEDSEGIMLRRLSDILTGGNASTWEQIVHAAEYHAACIKSSDAAMKSQTDETPMSMRIK